MRRKRTPTEDELQLFESTLADAVPLKRKPRSKKKTPPKRAPSTVVPPTEVRPQKRVPAPGRNVGLDGNTADRLRRGALEPQARLDLHGLTERDAHRALVTFLRAARSRKLRLVLIVTGKGGQVAARQTVDEAFDLGLGTRTRGVLRMMTPRWLREPGLVELVADAREAHRRHGGSGALYVYLRKG
jgi:DNA-nicking Smr family endonuclease